MYAAVRRYNVYPHTADIIAQRVNEGFIPKLKDIPGFAAYYVIDPGDETLVSVSVFDDKPGAEESSKVASDWVKQNISSLVKTSPIILTGEVVATYTQKVTK